MTSGTPLSSVRDGLSFRKDDVGECDTLDKGSATDVTVAFAQDVSQHIVRSRTWAISSCLYRRRCPAIPHKPF